MYLSKIFQRKQFHQLRFTYYIPFQVCRNNLISVAKALTPLLHQMVVYS